VVVMLVCSDNEIQEKVIFEVKQIMLHKNLERSALAKFLSHRMGVEVSESAIDAWFRKSRPHRFPTLGPLLYICEFISSFEPINIALSHFGRKSVSLEQFRLIYLGQQFDMLVSQAEGAHQPPRRLRRRTLRV